MIQKIILDQELSLEQLQTKIQRGARFISYQYCISILFAITLKRFSPAIFIENENSAVKYKKRYNLLSLIFGWWGIPWGPYYTVTSLKLNKKGGIDMTDDIMLNITDESLGSKEIDMKLTNQLFIKPKKWDIKALKKAFEKEFERDYNLRKLVVGRFINTEEDQMPYLTIGVKINGDKEAYPQKLRDAYETQFRKWSHYELIDLDDDSDEARLLELQGEFIISRVD